MKSRIRPTDRSDLKKLRYIIDATEMFPSELLDGMIAPFFDDPEDQTFWLTYDGDNGPLGVAYCAPEALTEGTWNLYLIAIDPARQGEGLGSEMMAYVEDKLTAENQRILLVETSGQEAFSRTRAFYAKLDYTEEARIREFYGPGDDKVVFWKKLG